MNLSDDELTTLTGTWVFSQEALAAMLLRYGLDDRARSALRAYSMHDAGDVARRRRVEAIESALAGFHAEKVVHLQELRRFAELFAALPEADFGADWLRDLAAAWHALRRDAGVEDLPLRAARAMVSHGTAELMRERASLSSLEVEIISALSAAGMCASEVLFRSTTLHGAQTVVADTADQEMGSLLARRLAEIIENSRDHAVGLIVLRLRLGPGTLTLSRDQRDALWSAAIERIRGVLRDQDVLLRTELHACAIIQPNLQTHAQVLLAANKLIRALEAPLPVNDTTVRAAFLLGVVWSPDHGTTAPELVRCAELASETARREDEPMVVFDDRMLAIARREALIEKEFPLALENGQLSVHIQPQIELALGQCIGGELLLRWIDSEGNPVPPYRITEVAKRIGAAGDLTRWLIFGACRAVADLARIGIVVRLSVNLMGRDLMNADLPLLVEQAIRFWRIAPACLAFELTEGMMLEDPAVGAEVMRRLIDLGVSTSIDDFGIGYSSILYLRQLPLQELKVDCVFVSAMSRSRQDREIVASLVQLSHALGLKVVAEGIEDEETLRLLRGMGCDRAQGYWISRAMPLADFAGWLLAWNERASQLVVSGSQPSRS